DKLSDLLEKAVIDPAALSYDELLSLLSKPVQLESVDDSVALMHALLDAPSKDEQDNDLRLEIVAKMIRINQSGDRLAPILEKMAFSHLSLCSLKTYENNIHRTTSLYDLFPKEVTAALSSEVLEFQMAVYKESSVWKKSGRFTAKGCCHVLNGCAALFDGDDLLFWMKTLLDCLKKEKREAASCLKREAILERLKTVEEPFVLVLKDIQKLFSENQLQMAYAHFLEGSLQRALQASCPEMGRRAIAWYQQFFPKLALSSPEERHITTLAIKLLCEGVATFSLQKLAVSALEAKGHSDLAVCDTNVLLFHPDDPFPHPTTKKKVTKHVKLKELQPLKERFFEIAVEQMHALLDAVPKTEEEGHIRLTTATSLISSMLTGKARDKQLIPLFEKAVFSRLSCSKQEWYIEHYNRIRDLHGLLVKHASSHPKALYKTALVCSITELAESPLTL
ncbi:MAG: hypothetical protein JSR46_09105, partial [Verrucomicrobia bacterium]|nr:hypothetical protein [Verrucomicrobiota bacterium]